MIVVGDPFAVEPKKLLVRGVIVVHLREAGKWSGRVIALKCTGDAGAGVAGRGLNFSRSIPLSSLGPTQEQICSWRADLQRWACRG